MWAVHGVLACRWVTFLLKKQVLVSFAKSAEDDAKLTKELGVVIPVSFFEEANNAHYNSVAIIDADGMDLGLYRKSHILDGPGYQEKFYFNSGDTGFKWFPEAARAMVLQGAEILFYPTAIGFDPQDTRLDSHDHWTRVMQGHAEANLVPLVASNRIGKEIIKTKHGNSEIIFYGNSFIAGPIGEIVASADDKDGAVHVAQFDLDKIKSKRHSWGVFRDWRPDLYKVLDVWNVYIDNFCPGCWKVWVNYVIVNAPLFHLNHEIFVLEDAIGSTVAWPTHFISFDFRTNIYG
ncbi:hypothetical protein TEA_006606 [Camellia sinensis var. sinensis]|uniref:CN hydrolase domain-containing protein n=1 Tax=Camellia sinensis var. sinensis TaxID=542762 RepID=A0A4S4EYT8_CAMSN|nr:hypothetical protein TEA_006606 [Camellia sinensis var. sinensis]